MIGPGLLNLISIVYGLLAVKTLYDVWRARQTLFDRQVTPEDARLAQRIAFYLLWPPAVLLHEGGHALVAAAYGAQDIRLHFFGYWGEISYDPTLAPRQDWWVAVAGNAVTYGLGLLFLFLARRPALPPIWRIIAISFAANQWFVVLFWYPLLCLTGTFSGDFSIIYSSALWWTGSTLFAAVNLISLAGYGWTHYTQNGKRWLAQFVWAAA